MTEQTAPRRSYRTVLLTASGATFLAMLDSTVTNLAIPALHDEFPSASVADTSWVITAYVVLFAALLASAGRLADVLGRRKVFLGGVLIFTLASLASAAAPNLAVLVGARAVQGLGAAAMIPAALAILLLDGPAERRAGAIALWGSVSALAAAVGPAIGGVLVDWLGWRSVFYINLPIGAVMLISALRILPKQSGVTGKGLPDPVGTVLLAGGIGALTLGVTKGAAWHWTDPKTLACLIGGVLAVALAVWLSTRAKVPAVETELWRNRTFLAANGASLLYGMAMYPWLLVTVLYIIDSWQYSELRAGFAMTPGAVFASAAALLAGRVTGRLRGPRAATLIGFLAFLAGGVWMVLGITEHEAFLPLLLPVSFVAGSGMGAITFGTSMAAAMSAPPIRFAGASGMNTMARQFGGALGVAALAVILESNAGKGIHAYDKVYLFCTVLAGIGLVLTWFGLRFTPPPAAPAAAPAVARPVAVPETVND
jgi:EmrB/QacA subfamily drug resistance transporter